ncbi:hypothetical protein HAV21_07400 [Paenarthrobacter sp. MSM-2-10-13]|uniref:hypothetical protein n=1 Tax=Micrococcaceae TaxID=1268 RepID=UPI00142035B8|nr:MULTISPECIES: hypothetical protein [Micrococcaceae]NHW46715.1 hypothetical protein [Paenarthrobacter sp. MSM-2-10-13]
MMLSAEAELPLRRVTFPPHLDHAWAFTTSAVHARPFLLRPNGSIVPQGACLEQVEENVTALFPAEDTTWTDGHRVTVAELERCVARGLAVTASQRSGNVERQTDRLLVNSPLPVERLQTLLATAAFSLTPCIRDSATRHTSGPYVIDDIGAGGRTVNLRRRRGSKSQGVDSISIISTESVDEGEAMFRRGELDLTRVLGGRPFRRDKDLNRSVDLVMGLRFARGSTVSQGFAASLDPLELAAVTGGTYTELPAAHTTMTGNGGFGTITIQYTDFHPNKTVATNIKQQLSRQSISCHLHSVDYNEYLRGDAPLHGAQLEIIDTAFGVGHGFVPLLRAVSTLSSSGRIRVDRPVVNARAEVDWEQIQWGEE